MDLQTPAGVLIGDLKNEHLFRYDGNAVKDLGTLGFRPFAVRCNASEQIVGSTHMQGDEEHAFLASGGKLIDLNGFMPKDSKYYLHLAQYINDHGVIVAEGWPKDAKPTPGKQMLTRTYVLTPG